MSGDHIQITTGAAGSGTGPTDRPASWSYRPRIDVTEDADEFVIRADVPGVTADGIRVDCADGTLTMHGIAPIRQRPDTEYLAHEYGVGDFDREIAFPDVIDTGRISAAYEAGVLTIRLPKHAKAKPLRIPVRAA
jgi:HSP20 family molecular chaperone IbpA